MQAKSEYSRLFRLFAVVAVVIPNVLYADSLPGSDRMEYRGKDRILLLHDGLLSDIDISGKTSVDYGKADLFAYDKRSDTILTCSVTPEGSVLVARVLGKGESAIGFLRLRTNGVYWNGKMNEFILSASTIKFQNGDIPFQVHFSVGFEAGTNKLRVWPIRGLSEAATIVYANVKFNELRPGTFAFSTSVHDPRITLGKLAGRDINNVDVPFLVITKDYNSCRAWPAMSITMSYPIDFSDRGDQLMVRLGRMGDMGSTRYSIFNLDTEEEKACKWLNCDIELVGVNRKLSEALVLVKKEAEGLSPGPEVDELCDKLLKQNKDPVTKPWMLAKIGENKEPMLIKNFEINPSIASIAIGEERYVLYDSKKKITVVNKSVVEYSIAIDDFAKRKDAKRDGPN